MERKRALLVTSFMITVNNRPSSATDRVASEGYSNGSHSAALPPSREQQRESVKMAVEEYTSGGWRAAHLPKEEVRGGRQLLGEGEMGRKGERRFPTSMPKAFTERRRQADGEMQEELSHLYTPILFFQGAREPTPSSPALSRSDTRIWKYAHSRAVGT